MKSAELVEKLLAETHADENLNSEVGRVAGPPVLAALVAAYKEVFKLTDEQAVAVKDSKLTRWLLDGDLLDGTLKVEVNAAALRQKVAAMARLNWVKDTVRGVMADLEADGP